MDAIHKFLDEIINLEQTSVYADIRPDVELFNIEDGPIGDIKRAVIEQNKKTEQQMQILQEQNALLAANYTKLEETYTAQVESYKKAQDDLTQSRKFNIWMMVVAVIAMFAAIAGPIATIMVSA